VSFVVVCHFCKREVDADLGRTAQFVSGWERKRKQGGTNALILRKVHPQWACGECIDKLRAGIDPAQQRLT
jgi:hypothetical protein